MAKTLRTAAIVVGAVALAASGVGALGTAGVLALGTAAGTVATIAAVGGLVAAGLSLAASALAPKPSIGGNPVKFKIDKESGIPIVFGRTFHGGRVDPHGRRP